MPIATPADLLIDQYADFSQTFIWVAGGVPVNYTGSQARMMIRLTPTDVVPLVSISTTPNAQGSIVLGPTAMIPAGGVQININKTTTAALGAAIPAGIKGIFDLLVDFSTGLTTDLAGGNVQVHDGATH